MGTGNAEAILGNVPHTLYLQVEQDVEGGEGMRRGRNNSSFKNQYRLGKFASVLNRISLT